MAYPIERSNSYFFSQHKILPSVKISVVIPVRDEESYILQTLRSLAAQVDIYGNKFDITKFELLILANNCSDDSVNIIKEFQLENPEINIHLDEVMLAPELANIGFVRRQMMGSAYSRLIDNGDGIIMTTDGDTAVSSNWICQTIQEIDKGADVVGGRIFLYSDELEDLDPFTRLLHLKDEEYQLLIAELEGRILNVAHDPVPRHHQHFNGSFAITTECYARSGGVPVVEHLEDCAFFDRLESIDAKIRHSFNVTVFTSARFAGRAQIGLSYQLNVWKNFEKNLNNYYVESCTSILRRLDRKKNLMDLWKLKDKISELEFYKEIEKLDPKIIFEDNGYESFSNCIYFGEWFEQVLKFQQDKLYNRLDNVPIDKAIVDLQAILQKYPRHDFAHTSMR